MVDVKIFDNLPVDANNAVAELCERIVRGSHGVHNLDPIDYCELLMLFQKFCIRCGVEVEPFIHALDISVTTKDRIQKYFSSLLLPLKAISAEIKADAIFSNKFLTAQEQNELQGIIDSLRQSLVNTTCFSDEHKQRLLEKLEELQAEIHKPIPNFDILIGKLAIITAGLRAFGDATNHLFKPLTDILKTIEKLTTNNTRQIVGKQVPELPSAEPTEGD